MRPDAPGPPEWALASPARGGRLSGMIGISEWLLDHTVHVVVEWVVTTIVAASAFGLTQSLLRSGAVQISPAIGRTRQSPAVLVVGLLCGVMATICLLWGIFDPSTLLEPGAARAWLLLILGFTLGFAVMTVYAQHRWDWDEKGVRWRGLFRSAAIAWPDLTQYGRSWDGQFVARDRRGHVVRWTTFTLGYQALSEKAASVLAVASPG